LVSDWENAATTDPEQIEEWWTDHPGANLAVITAGLLVVDIDGADNPWPRARDMAPGAYSITPRGGSHCWYRQPDGADGADLRNTVSRLAEDVDTRANGGYALVAPSETADGRYYWGEYMALPDRDELPEPPAWLLSEIRDLDAESGPSERAEEPGDANVIPEGQRNDTLARLAGTMRRAGMGQGEITAALLAANEERCAPPLEREEVKKIAWSVSRYEPDQITVARIENHWGQMQAASAAEACPRGPVDPGQIPPDLLRVPGFVSEVMDYTMETAPYPNRVLAFAGALCLQGFLAGRKVRDPADNRTNLYLLALANSGTGKEAPRKVNQRVLLKVGLQDCVGDAFASGEGIEDRLFAQPSMLFQTDEIDAVTVAMKEGKEQRYEGIMKMLLKMYTSSDGLYPMRVKAGKEHRVIDQPSLCILGTAIPVHYYEALSAKMLTNGFFARLLILEAGERGKGQVPVSSDLPDSIVKMARWWAEFKPGEGNLEDWHPTPRVIDYVPAAQELLAAFREDTDREYAEAEAEQDVVAMTIWARAAQKARRLALIYACSEHHEDPTISEDAVTWAAEFVRHQTRRMLFRADGHVAENPFHGECLKVIAKLREAPGHELDHSTLLKRMKMPAKDFRDLIDTLQQRGDIGIRSQATGTRGPNTTFYHLAE
jgi:hypothetical protein